MNKQVAITHYGNIKKIEMDFKKCHTGARKEEKKSFWWHGPTRTGKTRKLNDDYPGAYKKRNKEFTWNGY